MELLEDDDIGAICVDDLDRGISLAYLCAR